MTELFDPWDALVAPSTSKPRSLETREKTERTRTWSEPSVLPEIEPRDGWEHKWVRSDTHGMADKSNVSKRLREGWEPIDVADYPELLSYADNRTSGRAEVGGLIACRMPTEMVQQRNQHYTGIAKEQETSAETHYMRDNDQVLKKFQENSRKIVFGPRAR